MNAYVMTGDGVRVLEGAGWLEVHPEDIVVIRGGDPERRPIAAVKLSDRLWVSVGERPPAQLPEDRRPAAAVPALLGEGSWPPEPPPDVDSES